jgi:hypothetical protein
MHSFGWLFLVRSQKQVFEDMLHEMKIVPSKTLAAKEGMENLLGTPGALNRTQAREHLRVLATAEDPSKFTDMMRTLAGVTDAAKQHDIYEIAGSANFPMFQQAVADPERLRQFRERFAKGEAGTNVPSPPTVVNYSGIRIAKATVNVPVAGTLRTDLAALPPQDQSALGVQAGGASLQLTATQAPRLMPVLNDSARINDDLFLSLVTQTQLLQELVKNEQLRQRMVAEGVNQTGILQRILDARDETDDAATKARNNALVQAYMLITKRTKAEVEAALHIAADGKYTPPTTP